MSAQEFAPIEDIIKLIEKYKTKKIFRTINDIKLFLTNLTIPTISNKYKTSYMYGFIEYLTKIPNQEIRNKIIEVYNNEEIIWPNRSLNNDDIKAIVKNNCNINKSKNKFDLPLLLYACKHNYHEIFKIIFENEQYYNYINKTKLIDKTAKTIENNLINKIDINIRDYDDKTPLFYACINNNRMMVEKLLDCGVDINMVYDYNSNTILHHLLELNYIYTYNHTNSYYNKKNCTYINYEIIKKILEYKPDLNIKTKNNKTILTMLYYNYSKNDDTCINKYIKYQTDLNLENNRGETLLVLACKDNNIKLFDLLIEYGADINYKNKYQNTPLHYACEYNNIEIVNKLLKLGCNINYKNKDDCTALFYACNKCNIEIVEKILKTKKYDTNDDSLVGLCSKAIRVDENIYYNSKTNSKYSNIYYDNNNYYKRDKNQEREKNLKKIIIIKKLIEHGFNINQKSSNTPAQYGIFYNYNKSDNTPTPLIQACKNNKLSLVNTLLKYNPDINNSDYYKNTCLHIACENNNIELLKLLLNSKLNININSRNNKKETALHIACKNVKKNLNIINVLLEHKIDQNIQDSEGNIAIMLCYKNSKAKKLLISYDIDETIRNNKGLTIWDIAKKR